MNINADLKNSFDELKDGAGLSNDQIIERSIQLLELTKAKGELELECELLTFLGRAFRIEGEAFKSISTLNKAFISINSNFPFDKYKLAPVYRELSNVYSNNLNEYITAIDYCFKGYKLNVPHLNGVFLNNLGSIYTSLRQFDSALKYLNKAVEAVKSDENLTTSSYVHHNFGEIYNLKKEYKEAIRKFNISLDKCKTQIRSKNEIQNTQNIVYLLCQNYISLAESYISLGEFDNARKAIELGKKVSLDYEQDYLLSNVFIKEGQLLLAENKIPEYKKLYKSSVNFCNEHSFYVDKVHWLKASQNLFEEEGDLHEALAISKEILTVKEDISNRHVEVNVSSIMVSKEEEIIALEAKNRQMKMQKEELEQFAYIVTHDLKTPLSNISNFSGLFAKKYEQLVDSDGKEYLDFIIGNSVQMKDMLSGLLEYIQTQKNPDALETCNFNEALKSVISKNNIKEESITTCCLNVELPIYRYHLESILDNLISNALKFKREEEDLKIGIGIEESDDLTKISISDNGIGIDTKYRDNIFDIFSRLEKNKYAGNGMGLAICKKLVKSYSGNIWVDANEPHGSIFHFTIKKEEQH